MIRPTTNWQIDGDSASLRASLTCAGLLVRVEVSRHAVYVTTDDGADLDWRQVWASRDGWLLQAQREAVRLLTVLDVPADYG